MKEGRKRKSKCGHSSQKGNRALRPRQRNDRKMWVRKDAHLCRRGRARVAGVERKGIGLMRELLGAGRARPRISRLYLVYN
jgi:hypothetical protein